MHPPLAKPWRSWLWLILAFAGLKLAIQVVGNVVSQHAGYGIFRDELYFLVCGRRLAFGYVDQPPLAALQARITEMLFGHDYMWSLRLFSALAGAAKVALTGLLARALGGNRWAAALAMFSVITAGVYLGIDGYLSMNSFDPVFWMTCTLALINIVKATSETQKRNWWIVLGISAGLGLENKASETFFLACISVGLLITPQRRILKDRWVLVCGALVFLLALPNLLWQIYYHFPTLEWLRAVRASGKDVQLPPVRFMLAQILTLGPQNCLLWGTGVVWLLIARVARPFRFIGIAYVLLLALMMYMHAKDYYPAPAYPVYFAAGAVAWVAWAGRVVWRRTLLGVFAVLLVAGLVASIPFAIPVLPPPQYLSYAQALHMEIHDSETESVKPLLPQFFADRFGWSGLAAEVNRIYHSLPESEQRVTGIFAQNYGEAGAIDVLGRPYGLPEAISGHQNYWIWGPRGYSGEEMIIITDGSLSDISKFYQACRVAGHSGERYSMPFENRPIYLCRGRKQSYASNWDDIKLYH